MKLLQYYVINKTSIWRYFNGKNVWYFCFFYKHFHRDSVLQFIILWCAPVTRVLHKLANNYYKVKSLIPFSISYFELLIVTYCFCQL